MQTLTKALINIAFGVTMTAAVSFTAQAADWSATEVQLQYGDLKKPFQGGGSSSDTNGTTILTFQHASGWKYGDNFFFIDHLNYGKTDFEDTEGRPGDDEFYGEWYSNFSLGKISGKDLKVGFIKDVGLIAGFNIAPEVDTLYYLPGVSIALDIPGFAFAQIYVTGYIQNGASNVGGGTKIEEDDSYMIDFSWAYPFTIGSTKWSFEGHVEYIDGADTDVIVSGVGKVDEGERESWILAQPQLRLDLGNFWGTPDQLFVGIEYQYWNKKLGDNDTEDNVAQLLAVWRF